MSSTADSARPTEDSPTLGTQVAEEGTYELVRRRLEGQARRLRDAARALNVSREALFGGSEMALAGAARIRSEHNCVARDIANVGSMLLFGFNVYIGLKSETKVEDVFSLHRLDEDAEKFELHPVPIQDSFLDEPAFRRDFRELYDYYKEAELTHLRRIQDKLLAVFRTGRSATDVRVFRWRLGLHGEVTYIDARGERDNVFPPSHGFEWTVTGREHHVTGRDPHVSIEDEVFVNTVGGTLTIKAEDNTDDGLGLYSEPVEDEKQTLADAEIHYARVGNLILLKIRPYREPTWRHLVFNPRTATVTRIDAIGAACVELPEEHGLIFPGGYYLTGGEHKTFEAEIDDLEFQRQVHSANGEDVLYVFHHLDEGRMMLLSYNLIRKELENPIHCHGYSLFPDGRLVVFRFDGDDPARVHPMQLWRTAYYDEERATHIAGDDNPLARVGNAELVRGISDGLSVCRMVEEAEPSVRVYEDLIAAAERMANGYHWLDDPATGGLLEKLRPIQRSAELILGEFEKVQALRAQAERAMAEAESTQTKLLAAVRPQDWNSLEQYLTTLGELRRQRGHLITLRDIRYIERARLDAMESSTADAFDTVGAATVTYLLEQDALASYHERIEREEANIEATERASELEAIEAELDEIGRGLDLLNEILASLKIADAADRTAMIEAVSEVYAKLNRVRALHQTQAQSVGAAEARAEFAAQFALLSQAVTSAMAHCDSPDATDEQLNRLLIQLEELEGQFGGFAEFVDNLAVKREEIYEAFEARKQALLEERQRRAMALASTADRILAGVSRRAQRMEESDELNAYFATDPMVLKLHEVSAELRTLGDAVRSDDLDARIKAAREQAGRALRDQQDIYEDGGKVIRLGRHRFSVVDQGLELTLLPRGESLSFHLTGTDYFADVQHDALEAYRDIWEQEIVSESPEVYRAEYLAAEILAAAESADSDLTMNALYEAMRTPEELGALARASAAERYDEGYDRGVHDADTAAILARLLELRAQSGLLRFGSAARALAALFWAFAPNPASQQRWATTARSHGALGRTLGPGAPDATLVSELAGALGTFVADHGLDFTPSHTLSAARYLALELEHYPLEFTTSGGAGALADALRRRLEPGEHRQGFEADLRELESHPGAQVALALAWLRRLVATEPRLEPDVPLVSEAAVLLITEGKLARRISSAATTATVEGLLGQHPRIKDRTLRLALDDFEERLLAYRTEQAPRYRALRELRHRLTSEERDLLRLEEFRPRPLATFVRNRLIDEVYLPLIGDNLAKQVGTLGDDKRTDQMGVLLLISPPGYGKTTLMEYVASRLGFVFMKINCPSLGHDVTSVDPGAAPDATARQELEKLNLALEMGNNVMLYLDDIQHTNPEFLQKFISLGDAQRRIEGTWRGRTRTYDMRGKRFCIIMAGNPYTESGEAFQIPDMLANRADIYNLGDVLGGREDVFAMSYIENSLTSNPTLAPLATRDLDDLYRLIRISEGEEVPATDLSHPYSGTERHEMTEVLRRLTRVREVLLRVNQQYITSAGQDDIYRTEPPFKLQGSYRDMNKLAEKVVAVMTDKEVERLIDDHYQGEAQTLTTGAEENLLKLRELRGTLSPEDAQRWQAVKRGYARVQAEGGRDADPVDRVVGQLADIRQSLSGLGEHVGQAAAVRAQANDSETEEIAALLNRIHDALEGLQLNVRVINQPVPGMQSLLTQLARAYDDTLLPLLSAMRHKLSLDESIWRTAKETHELIRALDARLLSEDAVTEHAARPLSSDPPSEQG